MDMLSLGQLNKFYNPPAYTVKVRGLRYLWGSSGLTQNLKFEKAFILHIANDEAGKPVAVGTLVATGAKTGLGTIQPGECLSIPVNDISGIYADCTTDSLVHCSIY